jgi:hypothetical protein
MPKKINWIRWKDVCQSLRMAGYMKDFSRGEAVAWLTYYAMALRLEPSCMRRTATGPFRRKGQALSMRTTHPGKARVPISSKAILPITR